MASKVCASISILPTAVLALCLTIGCGKSGNQMETATVSGRVTLSGRTVTSGIVYATPSKGKQASGRIAEDGTFTLGTYSKGDGAIIGTHALTLTPIPSFVEPTPSDAVVPPERYRKAASSGLTMEVPPEGLSDYVIELVARPGTNDGKPPKPQPFE